MMASLLDLCWLQAIISKRNIELSEVQDLNSGVDLNHLTAGQLLKLPANRSLLDLL